MLPKHVLDELKGHELLCPGCGCTPTVTNQRVSQESTPVHSWANGVVGAIAGARSVTVHADCGSCVASMIYLLEPDGRPNITNITFSHTSPQSAIEAVREHMDNALRPIDVRLG